MRRFSGLSALLPAPHDVPLLMPQAWARGRRADPPTALVVSAKDQDEGPDVELHEVLREFGFTSVTDPLGPLTRLRHLLAHPTHGDSPGRRYGHERRDHQGRRELQIHDRYCGPLFRMASDPHQVWPRTLASSKRIGLIFDTGFTHRMGASIRLAGRAWERKR